MKCDACAQEFVPEWIGRHACFGSADVTLNAMIQYLASEKDEHGCLVPTKNVQRDGYKGKYRRLSKHMQRMTGERYAHRAILQLKLGRPITEGLDASHTCGDEYENGACVNPHHLVEETRKQNIGRMSDETRTRISSAGGIASPTKFKSKDSQ